MSNLSPGTKIKRSRTGLGMTQQQLTDKLNDLLPSHDIIERTMLSRWEKDLHFPRPSRKAALEETLGIKLGNPPPRATAATNYIQYKEQIQEHLLDSLQGCKELWITSANSRSGVWQGLASTNRYFEKMRRSETCLVRELFYVQTLNDIKKVKELAEAGYPNYRIRARIAPGQPLPILYIPNKKLGIILSGFGDDMRNVGLELNGDVAGFVEHTFRYRWVYSLIIADGEEVHHDKIRELNKAIRDLGGSTDKLINIR